MPQPVQFKLAVIIRSQTPTYLADYCVPVSDVAGRRCLRSSAVHQLTVPRVRRSTFGSRAFFSVGPTVWNSLPEYLPDSAVGHDQFRHELKNVLVCSAVSIAVSSPTLEVFNVIALYKCTFTYLFTH